MIIAIDGPSGTGKSTVAKGVARFLGFSFFDTGAMYRAFAWHVLQHGASAEKIAEVRPLLESFVFTTRTDEAGEKHYFVKGEEVTKAIREPQISFAASKVATHPEVRSSLVKIQRAFGKECNAVFEGRDMGTVVFPDADVKIFLTASAHVRAERRYRELQDKFPDLSSCLHFEEILKEMQERDESDMHRTCSPLKKAEGAVFIDTSTLSVQEVIQKIVEEVPRKKQKYPRMKFFYWFILSLARIYFRVFFRFQVKGLEFFRPGKGVVVGNHTSNFDPPVLSAACPEEVHFIAKASLFRSFFLRKLISALNAHPVARGRQDAHVFRELLQLLDQGKKVLLFPEGTRSEDGSLLPLQRGLSFIVQKAKCPIFPCYIEGTFDAWPMHEKIPKFFGKISCYFGPPIEWHQFEGMSPKEAEEAIRLQTALAIASLRPR